LARDSAIASVHSQKHLKRLEALSMQEIKKQKMQKLEENIQKRFN
jgi:hypothetical protein